MKDMLSKLKSRFSGKSYDDSGEEYLELSQSSDEGRAKVTIRPFVLEDFSDTKEILDAIREGYTIPLINIRPLKEKEVSELKRAINKLKKTTDAIGGEIAGFGEDWLVIAPSFAQIYKSKPAAQPAPQQPAQKQQQPAQEDEDMEVSTF